jgi:nucleotide-binding universal stress UspA family protein
MTASPVPSVEVVLVPVDGSDESMTAVEYALAVADRYDAAVHALYVHGEETVRAVEEGLVDDATVADDSTTFLDEVDAAAADADVPVSSSTAFGFSTTRKTQHPGSVVLDTAEELDADFIVVPREDADESGDILAKAAQYVLLYASQPVLSI